MTTLGKLLAVLGIAFIVCTASSKHSWGQTQTLTAFYTAPVVSMAPMWIAKEAGFFKKQGLDVQARLYRFRSAGDDCDTVRGSRCGDHRRICADTGDYWRS